MLKQVYDPAVQALVEAPDFHVRHGSKVDATFKPLLIWYSLSTTLIKTLILLGIPDLTAKLGNK